MKKLLMLCVVMSVGLFGCGSGSMSTSGSLSLSVAQTSDKVSATATYKPASGSALPGQVIDFRWYTVGITSKTQTPDVTTSGSTTSSGEVDSVYTLPSSRSESVTVYVVASTGGLTKTGSIVVAP